MLKHLENLYRKIPEGYPKSVIRNIISYILHYVVFDKEMLIIDGIKLLVYKRHFYDNYDNTHLAFEVSGYTKYAKLKKGDIVVDGGAYSGFFTIYAAKKVGPKGKVLAFEPDPFNYHLLKKNLALNDIKNVILIKKGLYSRDTTLPFYIQGIGSSIIIPKGKKPINKVSVVSLDDELKRLDVSRVHFVKMDIEGGEIEAIKGCLQTIKDNPNIHLAIASYHLVQGKETNIFLERFFKKNGLEVLTEKGEHPTTYASRTL